MSVIDDYFDKHTTPTQRVELEKIRQTAKKLVPEAEETISYGIPTLKYKGTYLIYFAAFKNHMSVFPGAYMTEQLKKKLDGYKMHKGTVQFTEDNPLPESIIKEIVTDRLKHLGEGYK